MPEGVPLEKIQGRMPWEPLLRPLTVLGVEGDGRLLSKWCLQTMSQDFSVVDPNAGNLSLNLAE